MILAALFDLDGTLLDTLADLADAVNHALSALGCPRRSMDEIRSFVGNGAVMLIRRALPQSHAHLEAECLLVFKTYYAAHMDVKTRPYPGILDMLDELTTRSIHCAVVSNKFDGAVGPICRKYFGDRVALAIGEKEGVPPKPAPDGCLWTMEQLGVKPSEAIYVGDSDTDVLTAHNAGLQCVGVSWGFRTRQDLERAGADIIVDSVDALLDALRG